MFCVEAKPLFAALSSPAVASLMVAPPSPIAGSIPVRKASCSTRRCFAPHAQCPPAHLRVAPCEPRSPGMHRAAWRRAYQPPACVLIAVLLNTGGPDVHATTLPDPQTTKRRSGFMPRGPLGPTLGRHEQPTPAFWQEPAEKGSESLSSSMDQAAGVGIERQVTKRNDRLDNEKKRIFRFENGLALEIKARACSTVGVQFPGFLQRRQARARTFYHTVHWNSRS